MEGVNFVISSPFDKDASRISPSGVPAIRTELSVNPSLVMFIESNFSQLYVSKTQPAYSFGWGKAF